MTILILGNASDPHACHVKTALEQSGATVEYWDTQLFPAHLKLSWRPDTDASYLVLPDGNRLDLRTIRSVFWRSFSGVTIPPLKNSTQAKIALNDAMSVLRSLLQLNSIHWVNSWRAYQFHKEKPLQLSQIHQLGITIPPTLISNDPDEVIEFIQSYPRSIFKPVYGGAHTQFVTSKHLEPERLSLALKVSPATFQAYVPGTNIRSYVIADSVYTAEIRSHSVDFREDVQAELIPLTLPDSVRQQCLTIAKALMLEWTAIDWRLTPQQDYVFLEANPSPMFLHFEQQTGFPITQDLVQLLIN